MPKSTLPTQTVQSQELIKPRHQSFHRDKNNNNLSHHQLVTSMQDVHTHSKVHMSSSENNVNSSSNGKKGVHGPQKLNLQVGQRKKFNNCQLDESAQFKSESGDLTSVKARLLRPAGHVESIESSGEVFSNSFNTCLELEEQLELSSTQEAITCTVTSPLLKSAKSTETQNQKSINSQSSNLSSEQLSTPTTLSTSSSTSTINFLCPICLCNKQDIELSNFPCNHKVCKECLQNYVKYEIMNGVSDIRCPVRSAGEQSGSGVLLPLPGHLGEDSSDDGGDTKKEKEKKTKKDNSTKPKSAKSKTKDPPSCSWKLGPTAIANILQNDQDLIQKYERFQLARALSKIPNIVHCPFPDCNYSVIAPKKMKKCPKITCLNCANSFCFTCRKNWDNGKHVEGKKCGSKYVVSDVMSPVVSPVSSPKPKSKEANSEEKEKFKNRKIEDQQKSCKVQKPTKPFQFRKKSESAKPNTEAASLEKIQNQNQNQYQKDSKDTKETKDTTSLTDQITTPLSRNSTKSNDKVNVKPCPRCKALISKMNDGSCNHMKCTICNCSFCWLCLNEVTDVHFLSPSGCTFWGTERWSVMKRRLVLLFGVGVLTKKPKIKNFRIFFKFFCSDSPSPCIIPTSPIIILLISLLIIPAAIVGLPYLVRRFLLTNESAISQKFGPWIFKTFLWTSTILTVVISPLVAVVTSIIVIPLTALFVYVLIPLDLYRTVFRGNGNVRPPRGRSRGDDADKGDNISISSNTVILNALKDEPGQQMSVLQTTNHVTTINPRTEILREEELTILPKSGKCSLEDILVVCE